MNFPSIPVTVFHYQSSINQTKKEYLTFLDTLSQFQTTLPLVVILPLEPSGNNSSQFQSKYKSVVSDILKIWTKDQGLDQAVIGPLGKPYLDALSFNYSTSHNWLGLILAKPQRALGIDIESRAFITQKYVEKKQDRIQAIIDRFYTSDEKVTLEHLRQTQGFVSWRDTFFRYWTMKEAFVKGIGESIGSHSLGLDLTEAENWYIKKDINGSLWYTKGVSQKELFLGISIDYPFELEYILNGKDYESSK